ncbi:DUF2500 domain-containing protein [Paenibacillus glycanilyticus]|uniref:DUF2500 domain-containing protein n=1 Tax=Paenibacillus glycanilyticus TaxID=126569 RepID=A0ABQ6GBT3_9BACL|nr:DUF2500 domain-containing protein [Paenibacillus glycanilyticus]GLX67715.1 hypothetical protein MU1_20600 [Paenibacillus glycanilyticus]
MINSNFGQPVGFDLMFTIVPIIIVIGFVIVIGTVVFRGIKYAKNATSPKESVFARVVSKRMDVRQNSHNHNGQISHSSRTYYYITLEFDNGERQEFMDVKNLFGLVAEGDTGYAATQGEWIIAFQRNNGATM